MHYAITVEGLYDNGIRFDRLSTNRLKVSGPRLTLTFYGLEALPGRDVVVRYDQAWANTYVKTLKYNDGNDVASFTQTVTRPTGGAGVAPVLTAAQVAGTTLTMTFDRALDPGSAPAGSRFRVNHARRDWSGQWVYVVGTGTAAVSGQTVTVTLASSVPQGRWAQVAYSRGNDANPLRGASSGPQVQDIGWPRATVVDRDPPQQTGALLVGTSLVLYYDETLDTGSTPPTSSYSVRTVSGSVQAVTVSGVAVHANAVELTLDWGTITPGNVRVDYTPGSNSIRDVAGNGAGSLTAKNVTRQGSNPTVRPFRTRASADTEVLTVEFSQHLDPAHVPPTSAFTLSLTNTDLAMAGYRAPAVTGVAVLGTDVELTMSPWWYPCDGALAVTYAKPTAANRRLANNWGTEADALNGYRAINLGRDQCAFTEVKGFVQSGGGPEGQSGGGGGPRAQSFRQSDASALGGPLAPRSRRLSQSSESSPGDASGTWTQIVLAFDRALNPDTVPDPGAFTVTTHTPGAASIEVTDVEAPEGVVDRLTLSLSRSLTSGERVTVSYRRPSGTSGLWDANGQQVANFSTDVTAPAPNRAPVFRGRSRQLDNALPGFLVSLPLRQSHFVDPDGDPLTFTLTASRDDVFARLPHLGLPDGFLHNERLGRVFFAAKTSCALGQLPPPSGDAFYTVFTLTATDPDGESASATATFRTDPTVFACPSLASAEADGTTVTLAFDANLAPSYADPQASDFTVTADGVAVAVSEAIPAEADIWSDSGNTITLTLASPVTGGQDITVSYLPAVSPVAAAFAGWPAVNNSPAPPEPEQSRARQETDEPEETEQPEETGEPEETEEPEELEQPEEAEEADETEEPEELEQPEELEEPEEPEEPAEPEEPEAPVCALDPSGAMVPVCAAVSGNQLTLTFNRDFAPISAATARALRQAFLIEGAYDRNGTPTAQSPNQVAVHANTITLTLGTPARAGNEVSVTYWGSTLRDTHNAPIAGFTTALTTTRRS